MRSQPLQPKTGEVFYDFKFYPEQCGPLDKYYEAEDLFIPGRFFVQPSVTNDFALIKLKEKVDARDFIKLSPHIEEIDNEVKLSICGYPGEDQISTSKGQSGALIILEDKSKVLKLVGIHKGGVETKIEGIKKPANSCLLITAELINVLLVEAKRMGADLF
jgi:hypothetical protein